MAALTGPVALVTSGKVPLYDAYFRCAAADTFYKGALATYDANGQITVTAGADLEPAGVVMEQIVTTAANQLVRLIWHGLFKFANAAFTIANQGKLFYALVTSDNPADMTTTALGNTAAFGNLIQVDDDAVNGWIFINAGRKVVSAT